MKSKIEAFCLVLLQAPKCFVPVQIFWAEPKIELHLVLLQKSNFLNRNHLLVWHKKFGPAQNILGPVEGRGICLPILIQSALKRVMSGNVLLWPSV